MRKIFRMLGVSDMNARLWSDRPWWLIFGILTGLTLGYAVFAGGCSGGSFLDRLPNPSDPSEADMVDDPGVKVISDFSSTLGFVASAGILIGVGLLVASFFVPIIPRKVAGLALGIAGAAFVARYLIVVYGAVSIHIAFWLTIACGAVVLVTVVWPMALAWKNARLAKLGKTLEAQHPDAAVALQAVAVNMPKDKRRDLLAEIKGGIG